MHLDRSSIVRLALVTGLLECPAVAQVSVTDPPDSVASRGLSPTGQYALSQIESVNAATGGLTLSIPLGHLPPGPGGFSGGVNLIYNSSIYDVQSTIPAGTTQDYPYQTSMHGGGWDYGYRYTLWTQPRFPDFNLSDGCNEIGTTDQQAWFKNFLKTPDGGNHVLILVAIIQSGVVTSPPPTSIARDPNNAYWQYDFAGNTAHDCGVNLPIFQGTLVFATIDSTYIRVEATVSNAGGTWIAYLPDGTQVTGSIATTEYAQDSDATQVTDRNGNALLISGGCPNGGPCTETLTDLQNRSITIQFETNPGGTWTDSISWPGVNGLLTTNVDWTTLNPDPSINYYPLVNPDGSTYTNFTENLSTNLNPLPSVVNSIELPPNTGGGNFVAFNFTYASWGEIHSLTMSTGTTNNLTQQYTVAYTYCYDVGLSCNLATYPRPPATIVNPIKAKVLQYSELRDGASPVPVSEATSYYILGPPNAFTYPQTGTVGQVMYPDGTSSIIYTANLCPSTFKSRDFCPALPYQIQNRDSSLTRLGWASNTAPASVPSSAIVNPFIQYRTYTASGFAVSNGVQSAQDPNGNSTTFKEYDWIPNGDVQTNGAGFITSISDPPARTNTTTYYEQDQLQNGYYWNHSAPVNLRTKKSVTVGTATTQYTYDSALTTGNLIGFQETESVYNTNISRSWTYLANGNLDSATDANGFVTKIIYASSTDPDCSPSSINVYPTKKIIAQGQPEQHAFTYCYDDSSGFRLWEKDFDNNNAKVSYTYDDLGRPTNSTQTAGSLARSTDTNYDDVNLSVTTTSDDTGSQRLTTTMYFDALGRERLSVDGVGNKVQKAYRYGTNVSYELASNPYLSPGDPTMGWTVTTRDSVGRVTNIQHYSGSGLTNPPAPWGTNQTSTGNVSAAYNQAIAGCTGPGSTVTDETGSNTHAYCPDGLGRLQAVTEPNGVVTTYTYDFLDNLLSADMAGQPTFPCPNGGGSHFRCFSYALSRMLSATNPESGTIAYLYDNNGNLTQRTDANATVMAAVANPQTQHKYDGFNRPYQFSYTVANGNPYNVAATPTVTYAYDQDFKGALSSVSSSASSTSYTHDGFGRISGSTQTTPGYSLFTFTYGYSLTDQLTSIQYPSGRQVQYGLDAADRVSTVQNVTGASNYATISYMATGGIAAMTMGNGVSQQVDWNDRLQPTGVTAKAGQTTLLSLGFYPCTGSATSCTSGNNGNVRSQSINIPAVGVAPSLNVTQTYAYDSLNRLTQAQESGSPGWTQGYGYDYNGNRWVSANSNLPGLTSETPQSQSWFTTSNRINTWTYDPAGNIQQVGGTSRSFTYDGENRQATATINGAGVTYSYDGSGLRVSKTANGQTTVYVYDAWGNVAAEYGPNGTSACGTETCYLTVDHLGSTRMLTDSAGAPASVRRYDYLPFGQEILAGTNGRALGMGYLASADGSDPKFTGQYRDPETSLDWFNVRHMSGAQGRFQSVDPANAGTDPADPQTWNAYGYVGNNPLSYTDPSGMFAEAGLCAGGPVACAIGAGLAVGQLLAGLLGLNGGSSVPNWSDTAWALGPATLQPSPSADWEQMPASTTPDNGSDLSGFWDERVPIRGSGGPLNLGGIFGGGGMGPYIFSAQAPSQAGDYDVIIDSQYFPALVRGVHNASPVADPRFIAGWYGASVIFSTTVYAAYDVSLLDQGYLFGTRFGGNTPLLNSARALRIGWSLSKKYNQYVFRIGGTWLGKVLSNPHINLWPPSWWGGPPTP